MRCIFLLIAAGTLAATGVQSFGQVESPVLVFNRGMLWQSVFYGKIGPNFSNWGRRGIGLDWPGFDATWIRDDIGGPPSHLITGGFWVGARKTGDTVLAVEDWSMYGGTISNEPGVKYKITKHAQLFKDGANYWLTRDPLQGEEVIETVWEHNLNYTNVDDRERQLPIRVRRVMHQWSGSLREENYIIHEYTFKNISPEIRSAGRAITDTLYGFSLLLNYGLHVNSRSWTVLFPSLTPGARNTWFFYDPSRKMIWGRAGDYRETVADESFGFSALQGPVVEGEPTGEWLAPGIVGVRLLYATRDSTGQDTRVNKYGWSAASNSIDLSGPFTGIPATNESKYEVLVNIAKAASFVNNPADTVYMRRSRMWSMMSLGPWTILPGDSIVVALAEIVNGVDYRYAVNPKTSTSFLGGTGPGQGANIFFATADRAKATYDQRRAGRGYNHPDPPPAPKFDVDYYRERERVVANVVRWGTESEGIPDPDDGLDDLAGYKVYRSSYLPIGPWDSVVTVARGDRRYFSTATNRYTYIDSTVQIGANYYYALTAYDTGRASWNIDPTVRFTETGSNRVPPLESSIFANRTIYPFKATIPPFSTPNDVIVVPNPFVIREGFSQPGESDQIQFVNLPNPCTVRIFTIRGDLVATITVPEGTGAIASWNQVTDFGQYVESGVYIFHVDSAGGAKVGKFAIIR